jgi:hypothetical protein
MLVRDVGMLTTVRDVSSKAPIPILMTDVGRFTEESDAHNPKARLPIDMTDEGIVTESNDEQE